MNMIFAMLFLNFTFKDQILAENLADLAETPKLTWSLDQVPRGVVVRIVEGKLRIEALLNTELQQQLTGATLATAPWSNFSNSSLEQL